MECQMCKKTLSKRGSHFLCQGPCQGTFHRNCVKGLLADITAGRDRTHCNNCEDCGCEEDIEEEEYQITNKILKDIQKKCNVLPVLEKQMTAIKQSMSVLSEKYDELLAEQIQSKEKISKLEKIVVSTSNKCTYLEKCNQALEHKLQEYEQSLLKDNIEIVGIEQLPDENIQEIVTKVGKKIGESCAEIESVKRVSRSKPPGAGKPTKPSSIVVSFKKSGTESRAKCLKEKKKLKDVKSTDGGSLVSKIFINEDLNKSTKELIWRAKKEQHDRFKYIWVTNGRVLEKNEGEDETLIWIKSECMIRELQSK